MPVTPENMTTQELLSALQPYLLSPGLTYLNELEARIIVKGDSDDYVVDGKSLSEGGIRPHHAPIVP